MKCWVFKKVTFNAAHHLPKHKGNCANDHGHTYTVELGVHGEINEDTCMVIDMIELKDFLYVEVIAMFDHRDLNIFFPDPTAENIAYHVLTKAAKHFKQFDILVRVYETSDSWVEIERRKDGRSKSEPSRVLQ